MCQFLFFYNYSTLLFLASFPIKVYTIFVIMWFDIFVQILGFIAIGMNLIAVQFNKHFYLVLFASLGSLLFGVQYLFLGAYTGFLLELVGIVRNIIFMQRIKERKPMKTAILLFSLLTFIIGVVSIIMTWDASIKAVSHWSTNLTICTIFAVGISVISIVAKILSTFAYGIENPHKIRMLKLPTSVLWILYNLIAFSIAGVVNEIMTITSITIAEIRYKKTVCNKQTALNSDKDI